jgi:hypothetical protein
MELAAAAKRMAAGVEEEVRDGRYRTPTQRPGRRNRFAVHCCTSVRGGL